MPIRAARPFGYSPSVGRTPAAAAVVPAFGATAANADTGGLGPRTVTEGGTAYFAATLQCTAANGRGGECAYRYKTMPDTAKVDNSGPATKDYNPLTAEQAEAAVLCLTNEKRRRHGVPALTSNANLATSARTHADNSVARRWWDATDGNVSHDDPEIPNEPNTTNDIGVRIRAAGYCPNPRSWANSENTFSAARGTPQTDDTGAVAAGTFVQNYGSCT